MPTSSAHPDNANPSPNRLAGEKSPYLLQHAHNPVDWFPWGPAAFEKARRENKPIFLSIGYSTCHWCHVMAHESFENPETAAVMNQHFINVKLDREERPDIDHVYMTFVQATTGSGGWPLNVWLTPDLEPFVGGTYFPPADQHGRPGFKRILEKLADVWSSNEEDIRDSASEITGELRAIASSPDADTELPPIQTLDSAFQELSTTYDPTFGGFGHAPKFPRPVTFDLLHHHANRRDASPESREAAINMASDTLLKMAAGGIHDHIGGGFHRYSVDRFWHIPHYEKMLYDQAQIVCACLDSARLSGNRTHHQTTRDILAYVTRDLTAPNGGFYSAEDADSQPDANASHKTEGAFYVWKEPEIDELLGNASPVFKFAFGVEPNGNAPAESDPHGELAGTNTLIRRHTNDEIAEQFGIPTDQVASQLEAAGQSLLRARTKRPRPHLDDKILTAWNGLMISAFARAHQQLGDPAFLSAATTAASFIRNNLFDPQRGVLLRSYRQGPAAIDGFAADYAFLIQGLLDLYQADFDTTWLAWADQLQSTQDQLFLDPEHGGYFTTSGEDPHVLLRSKDGYDGAEPSANSVSAHNLLRLAAILKNPARHQQSAGILKTFSDQLEQTPTSSPLMLTALAAVQAPPAQIIIAGPPAAADTNALIETCRNHARPHQVVVLADGADGQAFLASHAGFYLTLAPVDGRATAYLCENFVCQLPTTDPQKLKAMLTAAPANR